jgi:hypothetical protein
MNETYLDLINFYDTLSRIRYCNMSKKNQNIVCELNSHNTEREKKAVRLALLNLYCAGSPSPIQRSQLRTPFVRLSMLQNSFINRCLCRNVNKM